jgi:transglutaminase-like putative cysteine protease
MTVASRGRTDLVDAAAIVPRSRQRIGEPRDVQRARLQLRGVDLSGLEIDGLNQRFGGSIVELQDPRQLQPTAADTAASSFLQSEPFIESDDPQILAEAMKAVEKAQTPRARAERLVRHVNALLEKKPTVSLPSAREVLRTRVGDCNEHTVLYVAMARAVGIPARISVGLAFSRGAFYYHAWPEVYIDEGRGRGLWLPVDPTFNQFPADALHLRLARGGLAEQARILPLIGKLEIAVLDLDMTPGTSQVVVGRKEFDSAPLAIPVPQRSIPSCWDWLEPRRR